MRYYSVEISDAISGAAFRTYTNFVGGQIDRAGLDVELDIPLAPGATPTGSAYVRVWGISLQDIAQSPNLNGKSVKVYGGMQKGLPLANPSQAGLLASGSILQAFGNWIGTAQSLDMYLGPLQGTPETPVNLVFDWRKGTPLADAIKATLSRGLPRHDVHVLAWTWPSAAA